ncbi:S8 family serine peptidase [Nostoc sp. FACHB-87]|uniref:S8 family peptidase n=1 Tax=Nostocaceae TaxID=1162 RepID=UPI00168211DB|nr:MULTISPECIES: S8 family serine peptidase [Nostocaceae]MBD2458650.1 S8 family serine peptidase [Nostoc sp. FACHB-87]MBD2479646.1 S8 family serine peptidase [Anabaena sp. FACHB-83]
MKLYIIRPKTSSVTRSLSLMSRKLTPQSRRMQAAEVKAFWQQDSVYQEIQRWIADAREDGVIQIAQAETVITGTVIVKMTEEEAARMREELPDADITEDRPIELIQPEASATDLKTEISQSDLWHLAAINLDNCRQKGYEYTGQDITIAVLDTGVDGNHPALKGRITKAFTFDAQNYQVLPMNPSVDTHKHGTHVAGLICGNKIGVAPNTNIFSGVIIPGGTGNLSDFILALSWVSQQPEISIVNISAGFIGYLPDMEIAIESLLLSGILPVCAVGNEGRNRTRSPGNYRDVVSVGSSTIDKRIAGFSGSATLNTGSHQYQVPNLVAPGKEIYSSIPGDKYEAISGTSMATPIVSGIAALILEEYPNIEVLDLKEELFARCETLQVPQDRQGYGLIQVKL